MKRKEYKKYRNVKVKDKWNIKNRHDKDLKENVIKSGKNNE